MSEARRIKIHTPEDKEKEAEAGREPGVGAEGSEAADAADGHDVEPPRIEFSVQELADKLAASESEVEEMRDRLLRVSAEFENYKKRSAREAEEYRKYANQSLLKEMLSAVDHIELAIRSAETAKGTDTALLDGLRLTLKELLRIFDKFDVKPIDAVGAAFDPAFHEAMMREENSGQPGNTVVREMQKGYLIGSRLLRPALVVVAAPNPVPNDPGEAPDANANG